MTIRPNFGSTCPTFLPACLWDGILSCLCTTRSTEPAMIMEEASHSQSAHSKLSPRNASRAISQSGQVAPEKPSRLLGSYRAKAKRGPKLVCPHPLVSLLVLLPRCPRHILMFVGKSCRLPRQVMGPHFVPLSEQVRNPLQILIYIEGSVPSTAMYGMCAKFCPYR